MTNLYKVSIETIINAPVEALFDFHLDTRNLPKITPSNLKVEILELPKTMCIGSIVVLDVTKLWIKQHWRVEIVELQAPNIITDKALESPFDEFLHEHTFTKIDTHSSLLRDNIYFSLPFAPFSNIVIPFVKRDIKQMFAYRHKHTKLILEENSNPHQ